MEKEIDNTPAWLRRTQETSWEPEILISGIVLLALTQVPRLLDNLHFWLEERTSMFFFYTSNIDDVIISALKASTYWLMVGLIIHLVMRSVWISFVGLSYVFPKGIQHDKLKLKPWFQERIANLPDFQHSVVRLENICSAIYATAFLFVMATLGFVMYLLFIILLLIPIIWFAPVDYWSDGELDRVLMIFTLVVAVPYLLDFVTLGWLKRIPGFWRVYKYTYRLMSFITLSKLYRGIYYGLITNISRWKFSLLILVYVLSTFLMVARNESNLFQTSKMAVRDLGISMYDGYYRDQKPARYSTWAHIQSQVVQNGVLELFLVHKTQFEKDMVERCDSLDTQTYGEAIPREVRSRLLLECMAQYYALYVDGIQIPMEKAYMRENTHTGQFGLMTWLDVSHMMRGPHVLEVKTHFKTGEPWLRASIPFFLDVPSKARRMVFGDMPQVQADPEVE